MLFVSQIRRVVCVRTWSSLRGAGLVSGVDALHRRVRLLPPCISPLLGNRINRAVDAGLACVRNPVTPVEEEHLVFGESPRFLKVFWPPRRKKVRLCQDKQLIIGINSFQ